MKLQLTFTATVDVDTDSFKEAQDVAEAKGQSICIQAKAATGYRLRYQGSELVIMPGYDEYLQAVNSILLG